MARRGLMTEEQYELAKQLIRESNIYVLLEPDDGLVLLRYDREVLEEYEGIHKQNIDAALEDALELQEDLERGV